MALGRLTTLAPGILGPDSKLKKGKLEFKGRFIQSFNGDPEVEIEYPGGYMRSHPLTKKGQWMKSTYLVERMVSVLRNKYGANEVLFTQVPEILAVPLKRDEKTGKIVKETVYGPWMTFKAEVK